MQSCYVTNFEDTYLLPALDKFAKLFFSTCINSRGNLLLNGIAICCKTELKTICRKFFVMAKSFDVRWKISILRSSYPRSTGSDVLI